MRRAEREREKKNGGKERRREEGTLDYQSSPFFLRDSKASGTPMRVKITPRRRVLPFSRGMIFTRALVSLALLSLRKNGDYS